MSEEDNAAAAPRTVDEDFNAGRTDVFGEVRHVEITLSQLGISPQALAGAG